MTHIQGKAFRRTLLITSLIAGFVFAVLFTSLHGQAQRLKQSDPALLAARAPLLRIPAYLAPASKPEGNDNGDGEREESENEIRRGFAVAPVHLNLENKNRALVGLGSYIVNTQSVCADCHSCPTYEKGHNPYAFQSTQFEGETYLAGGVDFGPGPAGEIVSRNITPDADGRPAGLTLDEFKNLMHTGNDPDHPGFKLFVMPWPIFARMTNHDLHAVYEYLRAIPPAKPGTCSGPGQTEQ